MKGIILAGGNSTRLYPATKAVCKALIPIYDKPLIYYPLSTLILAGITDILIISSPRDLPRIKDLLGDGSQVGIKLFYKEQIKPRGTADALIIGEDFIGEESVCIIYADNIFYGQNISKLLQAPFEYGAVIFGYPVKNPEKYGVIEFDEFKNVLTIEEKPKYPKSNYAAVGLYIYDNDSVKIAKNLTPTIRGEIEITDVNKEYLKKGKLNTRLIGRGNVWFDTGTPESMAKASEFVRINQKTQSIQIGCIEEAAFRMSYITKQNLLRIGELLSKTEYGKYLLRIAQED